MSITKKQIQRVLSEVAFTPSKDKVMQIIMDIGEGDTVYYLKRAQELLSEVSYANSIVGNGPYSYSKIQMAMRLLALVQVNSNAG